MKQSKITIDFLKPLYIKCKETVEQVDIIDLKNGKFMTYKGHVFSMEDDITFKN